MDANHSLERDGQHTKGVGISQIRLVGEREARQIFYRSYLPRIDARFLELAAIEGHLFPGTACPTDERLALQRPELAYRHTFARGFQDVWFERVLGHGCPIIPGAGGPSS